MRKRRLKVTTAVGVALLAAGLGASQSQALTIKIFGTSDLFDSGLYQNRMQTLYNATSPFFVAGDTLSYTSVGTGKALTSAENGFADLVLVHSPPLEKNFVTGGYSYEPLGRSLLYNDYVVVGPTSDPAGVTRVAPHDGVLAFNTIGNWGATHSDATFVSRNDASGTNVQEETMWGQQQGEPSPVATQTAQNAGGVAGLFQPSVSTGSTAYPAWYVRQTATAQQTQGANLISTSTCAAAFAPDGGCYTMTDRGTLDYLHSQGLATGLTILSQNNVAGGIGGVTELINPFHAYIVTPIDPKPGSGGVYPSGLVPNVTAATRFVNFLTGGPTSGAATGSTLPTTYPPVFQKQLEGYLATDNGGQAIFHPDAFPIVNTGSANPAKGTQSLVTSGGTGTVAGTLVYGPPTQPPLSAPINNLPVKIYLSTNGGTSWSLATSTSTGAHTGAFSVSVPIPAGLATGTVITIDVATAVFDDSADGYATRFSPYDNIYDWGTFKTH
jgi:ABC-type tungstate transport system permease subunit